MVKMIQTSNGSGSGFSQRSNPEKALYVGCDLRSF
jgi:hypothetical protein